MNRKDYIAISKTLRGCWTVYDDSEAAYHDGAGDMLVHVTERIGEVFAKANPCFDRENFLAFVRGEADLNFRPPGRPRKR